MHGNVTNSGISEIWLDEPYVLANSNMMITSTVHKGLVTSRSIMIKSRALPPDVLIHDSSCVILKLLKAPMPYFFIGIVEMI